MFENSLSYVKDKDTEAPAAQQWHLNLQKKVQSSTDRIYLLARVDGLSSLSH